MAPTRLLSSTGWIAGGDIKYRAASAPLLPPIPFFSQAEGGSARLVVGPSLRHQGITPLGKTLAILTTPGD